MANFDENLIDYWIERIYPILKTYIDHLTGYSDDAEDIAQEALATAFEKSRKFILADDKKKKEFEGFRNWVFRIAVNKQLNWQRKKNNNSHVNIEKILVLTSSDPYVNIINKIIVRQIMQSLSNSDKVIIELRIFEDMSYDEMSKILNKNPEALARRFYKIKQKFKNYLNLMIFLSKRGDFSF